MKIQKWSAAEGFSKIAEGILDAGALHEKHLSITLQSGNEVFKISISKDDLTFIKGIVGED
jgi:hypothetical protein